MNTDEMARAVLMERTVTWMKRAEAAEVRVKEMQLQLESLTPGGSEYHNDPSRCFEWIAERLRLPVRQQKQIAAMQAEVERLREALEMVEWFDSSGYRACPWCLVIDLGAEKHNPDCPRQKALGL